MSHMRPGMKIRFWTPRVKNRPDVDPPGLLKLVAALAILSVVAVLVYAVGLSLMSTSTTSLASSTPTVRSFSVRSGSR